MTRAQINKATCSRCGKTKDLNDLNGYDYFNNDSSHAYCRRLIECDSKEAQEILDWLIEPAPTCAANL